MIPIKTIIILSHLLVAFSWNDPRGADQVAVTYWDGGTIGLAHNYLAGSLFYEIGLGDTIHVVDENGKSTEYIVTQQGEYLFEGQPYVTGWLLVDNHLMSISDVIRMYSDPRGIVLITCFPSAGTTTGQRFLKLLPEELFAGDL